MGKLYKLLLFLFTPMIIQAQNGSINGQVVGEKGPVPFASVGVTGTGIGATTTEGGKFNLKEIPAGVYTLQASALGFVKYEQKVVVKTSETTTVRIVLQQNDSKLNEVVVTGTLRDTYQLKSPVPVEIYTSKYFQKNPTPAIFDALAIINGIKSQVNCNVCGTGDIHINGMEGPYTMVLIDGMPIVSALFTV